MESEHHDDTGHLRSHPPRARGHAVDDNCRHTLVYANTQQGNGAVNGLPRFNGSHSVRFGAVDPALETCQVFSITVDDSCRVEGRWRNTCMSNDNCGLGPSERRGSIVISFPGSCRWPVRLAR